MNLNEIKTALVAATPGPWMGLPDAVRSNKGPGGWICQTYDESNGNIVEFDNGEANIHLIANAPEWLASLIEHYEECQADALQIGRNWQNDRHDLFEALAQKDKMIEEMQKTLEWYANTCDVTKFTDLGERARQTLQSLKGAAHE